VFDRDRRGKIKLISKKDKQGNDIFVDKGGYQVNEKGYIINAQGHICTRKGKKLFHREHLKNNEPPKFLPFTRFNNKRVLGDFELDPVGVPMLDKDTDGNFRDK